MEITIDAITELLGNIVYPWNAGIALFWVSAMTAEVVSLKNGYRVRKVAHIALMATELFLFLFLATTTNSHPIVSVDNPRLWIRSIFGGILFWRLIITAMYLKQVYDNARTYTAEGATHGDVVRRVLGKGRGLV